MGIDIIIKLALGALDAFEAAEAEQVRLADVGDDAGCVSGGSTAP